MASSRRSRLGQPLLVPSAAPPPGARLRGLGRRRWLVAGAIALGLLALAWYDGGEKPLRPIAEPVALPGQPQ